MTQNIFDVMGRYTTLRRATHDEYMGPCPKCVDHGDDRLRIWVSQNRFWCRVCGWQGDTIDVIRDREGVGFVEAKRLLGLPDDQLPRHTRIVPAGKSTPTTPWVPSSRHSYQIHDPDEAHNRLVGADPDDVMVYLVGRGLTLDTIKRFGLGADRHKDLGPVVTIPWVTRDGVVVGVKTRAVNPPDGHDKNHSYTGSSFGILYGSQGIPLHNDGQPVAPDLRFLVVVEGEINALSVWQSCQGFGVDVLSVGAQSSVVNMTDGQGRWLRQWGCRLVWLDEDKPKGIDFADHLHNLVGGLRFASSMAAGLDANDLLCHGVLGRLVAGLWLRQLDDDQSRLSVVWAVQDVARQTGDTGLYGVVAQYLTPLPLHG